MKPIEGVELADIVVEASQEILNDQRTGLLSLIKGKVNELNQAVNRVAAAKTALSKAEKDVERLSAWLGKVKAGDWAVLSLAEKSEDTKPE
jgi:hypothetical protein